MEITFDLLIRNGMLVDGSGGPPTRGDVAVLGGVIAAMGVLPESVKAVECIDAMDKVVSPGFIDIHTHADIAMLARPQHLPKVMQGVTTEVFTNCGLGFAPISGEGMMIQRKYISGLFGDDGSRSPAGGSAEEHRGAGADWSWRTVGELLERYERGGIGANVAYLIPHGALRVSAMGMEERPATTTELSIMVKAVEEGMGQGAWGMSTGIWYAPMRAAGREELVALSRAAGFFATHQRDYGTEIFAATVESLEIAEAAGVPVQISHLQMNGEEMAGRAPELLSVLDKARTKGVDVQCDTYPYTAGSTFVQALLPDWATDGGPDALLQRLREEENRVRIEVALSARRDTEWKRFNLSGAQSPENRGLEGLTFVAAAEKRGMRVPEWICALLEEEELRACFVHHAAHEGNVRDVLQWDGQMVGSDGLHLPGKTHPRLYGTFPRVLGHYVRQEHILSLEQAIYKMTGMPAARLKLQKRGLLREGYAADLVIFDPATIRDAATFEDPLQYPTGIPYVFVNGVAAKSNNAPTGKLAGRVLRRI